MASHVARVPENSIHCMESGCQGQLSVGGEQKKRFKYCPKAESHKDLEVENPVLGSR